jgi:hypothetical protein
MSFFPLLGVPFQGGSGLYTLDAFTLNPFVWITGESINYRSQINLFGNFPSPIVNSGDAVGAWQDYGSTASYNPNQSTVGNRPPWTSNVQGGLGAVTPNGTNHHMTLFTAIPAASWNSDFTLFWVGRGEPNSTILGAQSAGQSGCFTFRINGAGKMQVVKGLVAEIATSNSVVSNTDFHVYGLTRSGNTFTFYLDGVADGATVSATTFTSAGSGFFHETGGIFFEGAHGLLGGLPSLLTPTQIVGVTNHQKQYWSIP